MYHVAGEVNDRGKNMADIYLEKMTLKVGHVWIQGSCQSLDKETMKQVSDFFLVGLYTWSSVYGLEMVGWATCTALAL